MAKPRARFEFEPYALPLVHPLRTAAGNVDVRRGWLVRLFEGDAVVGLGDVAPLRRAGTESYREARELIGQFSKAGGSIETVLNDLGAPGLLPFEQLEPGGWEEALRSALRSLPALRFGIDLALWDRAAKLAGLPLASILNPNAAYNVKANSLVTDDVRSPAALEELLAAGFDIFKLKVGSPTVEEDAERVERLRRAISGRASIRLDANGGWSSVEEASEALARLGLEGVSSLEQPLPPGSESEWGPLQSLLPCLAADESVTGESEAARLLALGTVDALVLKPMRIGGLGSCLRIAAAAREAGVEVWVTTLLESAIGRSACLHLASALGSGGTQPHGLLTGSLLESDVAPSVEGPGPVCTVDASNPGLGVALAGVPVLIRGVDSPPPARSDALLQAQLRAGPQTLSAQELGAESQQLGSHLSPGTRLGIVTDSSVSTAIGIRASQAAGASAILIDGRIQGELLDERIEQAAAGWLLAEGRLCENSPRVRGVATPLADAGLCVFTSGTTGRARMARLSWDALECSAAAVAAATELGPGDCWLSPLPLAHIGGVGVLFRALHSGATAEFLEDFDPQQVVTRIRSGEITHLSLVARMLERILEQSGGDFSGSALRWVLVGGGPTPLGLVEDARRAGLPVATTYGLTEAGSTVSLHRPGMESSGPRDAGWLLPHIELEIQASASGEPGEILVRGPSLFGGYEGEEGRTAESWFATGDWGRLDQDGRLHLEDRRQDLIVSGGENVYPAELEARLRDREEVEEVCVLGLPDSTWGQRVVAVLRLTALAADDPKAALGRLAAWCAAELPPWERPKAWELRDEPLPRTALLKLKRGELKDLFSAVDEKV